MTVSEIAIGDFRSIRSIRFPLRQLTVLVGGNGVGKTNLYRSIELLHAAATGTLAEEIAREGGLGSIHFAGELKRHETPGLMLEAKLDGLLRPGGDRGDFAPTYRIEIGFPPKEASGSFETEAQVKSERLTIEHKGRAVVLLERNGPSAWTRDAAGNRMLAADQLLASETALSSLGGGFPEVDAIRFMLGQWRFYHGFRTDAGSPLRRPALAVTSPTLSADGDNLAAVFATLCHIREDAIDLEEVIAAAFPGARLHVPRPEKHASFSMTFPDLPQRAFGAAELSDGTLHFLALAGALLSYRLPPFIALNEPETSLHPDLLPALAQLISRAATRTQVWVVTHSPELASALTQETGVLPREVVRRNGATWLDGLTQFGAFDDD